MPAVNDVYRVKLKYQVGDQRLMNIFHYQATGAAGTASLCRQAVNGQFFPQLQNIVSSDTVFGTWEVQNLNDPTDFVSYSWSSTGARGGTYSATHVAFSFTLQSSRSDAQSGGKRFGAVASADCVDGLPTSSLLTAIAVVENALSSAPTLSGCTYRPRIRGGRQGSIGIFANPISGGNFLGITSQNTRKFYTSPGW